MFVASVVLLLACLLTGARCQILYGLSLAPGQTMTQLVTPTSNLSLTVYWTEVGDINITALLDGATPAELADAATQATDSSQGTAVFNIEGSNLTTGR